MAKTHWYREEYKGREDELISRQEVAARTGYSVRTIDKWRTRYDDCPSPVKREWRSEMGTGGEVWYVEREINEFTDKRRAAAGNRGKKKNTPLDAERYELVPTEIEADAERLRSIDAILKTLRKRVVEAQEERKVVARRLYENRRFKEKYERDNQLSGSE
ncbi:hypothetical protein AB0B15_02920 [Streptomyces sp. NPDC045456]|uniref:helix-turn-helix transcriptional regulator n=1 Tax=Streptomyces sp. NPDC045456 TaxID=3155254 RepID=UPI00341162A3